MDNSILFHVHMLGKGEGMGERGGGGYSRCIAQRSEGRPPDLRKAGAVDEDRMVNQSDRTALPLCLSGMQPGLFYISMHPYILLTVQFTSYVLTLFHGSYYLQLVQALLHQHHHQHVRW